MQHLKTIVFGLSGNPPTQNHLLFIQYLLSLKGYDLVRVVLSAQSPLKPLEDYLSAENRFELLKAMLESASVDWNRCVLERLEIERPPPSKMLMTLKAFIARAKQQGISEQITLVLGLDALKQFTDWYEWDAFGSLCEIVFYPREDEMMSLEEQDEKLKVLHKAGIKAFVIRDEVLPMVAGSATKARAHYALGRQGIPEGITEVVDKLIRERGYYGATA
ncbi:MAG: nicotinate-nicotinamide nucleotide adenylyltransferase [Gammaproteobacteria bacterium]|nr:nicotinate-nicotinamide nucleotide adenylyltransferase [Gammaproteobacteria bacterium]